MTHDVEAARLGREPIQICEVDLDYCQESFGVAPCTASGAAGTECYNTRVTCQDVANYNLGLKTYRWCTQRAQLPVGIDMIPCMIREPTFTPTKIEPGKGLGFRGAVTVTLADFPHHDRGIDPYVATRTSVQGTYFGKLKARNPYYVSRFMRVREGYLTNPFDWANFEDKLYIIEKFEENNGQIKITGKDILKKADGDRAQCPIANTGKLLADITNVATSLTLTPSGIGNSEYSASGTYRIGEEIGTFTRSADVVTLTGTRGQWGTVADEHNADDLFQECVVYQDENVVDIIDDLLQNYAGISSTYIPSADWTTEKNQWLSFSNFTTVISKPEAVDKLLGELLVDGLLNIWWSDSAQEIKLKAIAPPLLNATPTALCDYDIIEDSVKVTDEKKQRVSQVWLYWNIIDYTKKEEANYQNISVSADLAKEGADQYGEQQIRIIKSRWIANDAQANQVTGRYLARFKDSPKLINFKLDKKDHDIRPGDLVNVANRLIQDVDGTNKLTGAQVVEQYEKGDKLHYKALTQEYSGRYGFIGPNTLLDYSSESADNIAKYAFICLDTGLFADGTEGYKII